ncbi:MAG: hypothetical protein ACC645_11770, partial [Pirellulales bacterium]
MEVRGVVVVHVSRIRIWWHLIALCWTSVVAAHCVFGQSDANRGVAATQDKPRPNAGHAESGANWQDVRGANYVPSYARNATEAWTRFDAEVLDRELGFAGRLGLNTIRFFVDVRAYEADSKLMLDRFDQFLTLCEKHNLRTIPQLFDSCGVEEADRLA